MSTRTRTKSGLSGKPPSFHAKKGRANSQTQTGNHDDMDIHSQGRDHENSKVSSKHSKGTIQRKAKGKQGMRLDALKPLNCICSQGNDGSPMILCVECQILYHFTCVDITETEAEEISVYICSTCTASTRRQSTMTWEGEEALEEMVDDEASVLSRREDALKTRRPLQRNPLAEESEESSNSGDDEYVEVEQEQNEKGRLADKIQSHLRNLSPPSDSDSVDETRRRRLSRSKVSPSPSASVRSHPNLKRKAPQSSVTQSSPAHKRKRSTDSHGLNAADDPARKYCLGKLEELFRDVFLRYPHVRVSEDEPHDMDISEDGQNSKLKIVPKDLEALTEEEKELLLNEARQFAKELESSVFEIYSEPDKVGQPHAGGKYKERFRMLQFNLSKVDRVTIHQRITSGNITAKEISLMSSTDLADEETKQSIKLAEKEALEHSILLKSSAPRAKITHKGLQDIEDVNGEVATAHEIERAKEREQREDERRERERMARLRTVQRQRTASMSVPPESPSIPHQSPIDQQWGAPPPVPPHAMSPTASDADESFGHGSRPLLFLQTSSEPSTMEPELNLADLINIDGEQESNANQLSPNGATSNNDQFSVVMSPVSSIPTGISPFAARPERSASFDLSSIWSAPKEEIPPAEPEQVASAVPAPAEEETPADGSDKDDAMELESVEANDQDFDMFLEEMPEKADSPSDLIVTPLPLQEVESLPPVWTGKIAMPLDSSVPQETFLVARQVAGRPIPSDSPLWRTLFPSEQLRIEGRVPVANSSKYLMQMRLNVTKELYAAAFIPASPNDTDDFKVFCNFLISKGRHGLVFPWGNRPKDYHPGRELYMIPLLQSEPLPEFVELLDELKLPKTRTKDYLLGIWILNKGKLSTLPTTTPTPPVQINTVTSQNPPNPPVSTPTFNTPPPPPPPPPPVSRSPSISVPPVPVPQLPPSIPGLPIQPAALAAEVASLTPEQLQEVLRTLAATAQIPLPPPPPPQNVPLPPQFSQNRPFQPHVPTPPMGSHIPTSLQAQPWMQHPPPPHPQPAPYPATYPPPNVPYQQPPRNSNSPAQGLYDRHDYDRDFRPGPHYSQQGVRNSHDDRGWRGNQNNRGGQGRGRGRGGGDGHDRDFNSRRTSDSGWPRRPRNDSQGGPSW